MREKPEFAVERSLEQKKKDYRALKIAKALEAEQLKKGATYHRIDDRTFVLKKTPKK